MSYVYRRYKPILFAAGSGESRSSVEGLFSATTWTAGVAVPFQTVRRGQQVLVAARRERLTLETPTTQTASLDLNALRVGWALGSSNEFGYSVSPEEGVDIGLVSELIRQGFGASGNAQALMAEARSYHRVVGQHTVLAARVAGAVSSGDQAVQRQFSIDDVGPADGLLSVAGDAVALFRGAGAARTRGPRAATVNLDLRFPLWRLERGLGVYPAFLKWVHASTFVDAADAWDLGDRVDPAIAAGVEVSADLAIGYGLPVTVTTGVSLRVDRHRDEAPRPHVFLRLGRAF